MNEFNAENFKVAKTAANNKNGKRLLDATDASSVLNYYARRQTTNKLTDNQIWVQVLGVDNVISAK